MSVTRTFHTTALLLLSTFAMVPGTAHSAIILDLTDGGGSSVNYSFSGSDTISPGFSVFGATLTSRLRLPEDATWSPFFRAGAFDDTGSALLGVTNVTSGIFAASGEPAVFVDGVRVPSSGLPTDGTWSVNFDDDPSFRFETSSGNFSYPVLTGGEEISTTGSGSFDIGSGTFASNFNVGSYVFNGDSGLDFQVNVNAATAVPEPSSIALLGLGAVGIMFRRRKRRQNAA